MVGQGCQTGRRRILLEKPTKGQRAETRAAPLEEIPAGQERAVVGLIVVLAKSGRHGIRYSCVISR